MGTERVLLEHKSTQKETLGVSLNWLAKIQNEAMATSRVPGLSIAFTHGDGQPKKFGKWIMFPEHIALRLIEMLEAEDER